MDKQTKRILLFIAFGVGLFVGLNHINFIWNFIVTVCKLLIPVIAGGIIAFFLNVPMSGFEKLLNKISDKLKFKISPRVNRMVSLLLTIICILLVIVLVCVIVIPEIISSVVNVYSVIQSKIPEWIELLKSYNIDTTWLTQWISGLNISELIPSITSSAGNILNTVIGAATSTVSIAVNTLFAIIISLYILLDKRNLSRQSKKVIYAHIKEPIAEKIVSVASFISKTFSKFLSGQCVEAIILAMLIFITFTIVRLPYASLIAVLAAVFSFIPYVGALAACLIGAALTLMVDPVKAIICIGVYLVVQFVESQFIYPHVVGNSVGLAPVWTLLAALIGGSLFGIIGMIFFIPVTAVVITLLTDYVNDRLKKRNIKIE